MLVDFYAREDVFAPVPKLAHEIDPVLRKLDSLLDDDALYQQVRADFGKRYRFTLVHGQHSTLVEVLLRLLILKHLYQWSHKECERRVADSLVLRWFCRVVFHEVPDASTLWRWEQTLRPETVHALNDRVVQLARQARVTKGRKLRLDATCVQTNIHKVGGSSQPWGSGPSSRLSNSCARSGAAGPAPDRARDHPDTHTCAGGQEDGCGGEGAQPLLAP